MARHRRDPASPGPLGCAAESIVGPHREVEQTPAVVALRRPHRSAPPLALEAAGHRRWRCRPGRLARARSPSSPRHSSSWPTPTAFPAEAFLTWLEERYPGLPVTGGMASAAPGPGGNRLALGAAVRTTGAVGVLLGPGSRWRRWCRRGAAPSAAAGRDQGGAQHHLRAGRPARPRSAGGPGPRLADRRARWPCSSGWPPHRPGHRRAPGALRPGRLPASQRARGRPATGALAVTDVVPVGTTVQFHLRDATDRRRGPAHPAGRTRPTAPSSSPATAGAPGCSTSPTTTPRRAVRLLGPVPMAGFFAAGEIGPVGGGTSSTGSPHRWPSCATPSPGPGPRVRVPGSGDGRRERVGSPLVSTLPSSSSGSTSSGASPWTPPRRPTRAIRDGHGSRPPGPRAVDPGHAPRPDDPTWPDRDRFVLSSGHASILHLLHALPHRLRAHPRRHPAVPAVGEQDAGPPRDAADHRASR